MGHHNFDSAEYLAQQLAAKPLVDQLADAKEQEKLEAMAKVRARIQDEEPPEGPSAEEQREALLGELQKLGARTASIPEAIKARMRRDRAKAESEQR